MLQELRGNPATCLNLIQLKILINLQQKDGATSIVGLKKIAWKVQRQVTLDFRKMFYE